MPMCVEGASLHLDNGLSLHKSHVQKRFVRAYYGKWSEGGLHKIYYFVSIFAKDCCNRSHAGAEKIKTIIYV